MHFHVFRINFLAQGNIAPRRVRDNDLIKCPSGSGGGCQEKQVWARPYVVIQTYIVELKQDSIRFS